MATLLEDAFSANGLKVQVLDGDAIVAPISPFRSVRKYASDLIGNFVEVWVKCSVETCRMRDPKGPHKKAADGWITNFTGIQDPYELSLKPEVIIDTENQTKDECLQKIMLHLKERNYIS